MGSDQGPVGHGESDQRPVYRDRESDLRDGESDQGPVSDGE